MKICELKMSMKNLEVTAKVISIRQLNTYSRPLSKATIKDESGEITLNLWGEQTRQCKMGDIIKITGGFVKKRYKILELNTWNSIQVIEPANA